MRIISGKYRGKKLQEFDLITTKPTLDRVKESIFNLVQFDVADAVVCDLFSGTGALWSKWPWLQKTAWALTCKGGYPATPS